MKHRYGSRWSGRRPTLRRRFGRRSALAAGSVPRVPRRPVTLTLLRRIEARTTHAQRTYLPRINVAVNLLQTTQDRGEHRLGAPLVIRLPITGQGNQGARASRLMWPATADTRVIGPAVGHLRPSLAAAADPVVFRAASVRAVNGERRGLIDAPAAATIGLSRPVLDVGHRRPTAADAGPADSTRRLRPVDAAAPVSAPVDIEGLTDKVISAIDRRLWSHRERMGGR